MRRMATRLVAFVFLWLTLFTSNNSFAQTMVSLPGTFQQALGCPANWDPACPKTALINMGGGIWEGTFLIPTGSWEYKVALNGTWDESYGPGGITTPYINILLYLPVATNVRFSYNAYTHIVTHSVVAPPAVTLVGSFQNEAGCWSDWDPACAATRLAYDAEAKMWYGLFDLPAGEWQYKVALNNSWTENYGLGGAPNGGNMILTLATYARVLFRYDPATHITSADIVPRIVVLAGDFQSELGCWADWLPYCSTTGLTLDPVKNLWAAELHLPAGDWAFKVTHDYSWAENYGEGGVKGGDNIALHLSVPSRVSFVYNSTTHVVTYTVKPDTVVIAANFQGELGCSPYGAYTGGDWEPDCASTRLSYDAVAKVWTGTFNLPAGDWLYKVALDNSWDENYGLYGERGGKDIPLSLCAPAQVTFTYNPQTHLVTLSFRPTAICVSKFYDANVNGINDEGMPLEGVQFTLSGAATSVQYTGIDGKIAFSGLTQGAYTVTETMPPGWQSTTGAVRTVNLDNPVALNFGNVCLGPGGARSPGFWTNKHGREALYDGNTVAPELVLLSRLNLRDGAGNHFAPATYEELVSWLKGANAKNMAYKLSAELAVLQLSVEAGFVRDSSWIYANVGDPMGRDNFTQVWGLIDKVKAYLGMDGYTPGGDPNRSMQEFLKDVLEQVNGNLAFVQPGPCGSVTVMAREPLAGEEAAPLAGVVVSPNPSSRGFSLRLAAGGTGQPVSIRVLDAHGKLVYSASGSVPKEYRFGEGFRAGLYFVEVRQGGSRSTLKVVKQ